MGIVKTTIVSQISSKMKNITFTETLYIQIKAAVNVSLELTNPAFSEGNIYICRARTFVSGQFYICFLEFSLDNQN